MSVRLAIIGPADSIALITLVAQEFKETVTIVERPYGDFGELRGINAFCREREVDAVLYSGQVPYYWVKEHENVDCASVFIPRNGTCLYRTLFEIHRDGLDVSALSFDTVSRQTIIETYEDLRLPLKEARTFEYDRYLPYEDLTAYHLKMWTMKKTAAAVTCVNTPFSELRKRGVITYRIMPTRSIIRQYLGRAILCGETARIKDTQLALILVKAVVEEGSSSLSGYEVEERLLDLHRVLLDYAKLAQGIVVRLRGPEFAIVATRGSIEEMTNYFRDFPLLRSIQMNTAFPVKVGLGFGRTALTAEHNARQGVHLSASSTDSVSCFMVTDDGKVIGPLQPQGSEVAVPSSDLMALSKEIGMKPTTLGRVKQAIRRLAKKEITSQELAVALGLSERTARRILARLQEKGLAKVTGSVGMHEKGRPRLIYRFELD